MVWRIPPGIIPNLLTPMTSSLDVDEHKLRQLVDFHIGCDVTGSLCIGVHLAQSHNLSLEERKKIAKIIVEQTRGRKGTMVSVASASLRESIELARHAVDIGADAVIAVPPYFRNLTQDDLFDFYSTLAKSIPISVIAYHLPSWQAGIGLGPELVVRLASQFENFVGIKDASFSLEYHSELVSQVRRAKLDFEVSLSLEWIVPSFPIGPRSAHSGLVAVAPNLTSRLFKAALAQDWVRARNLFDDFGRLWSIIYAGFPGSLNSAMALMGRSLGPLRPPLEPLSLEADEELRIALEELGLFSAEPFGWC